MEDKIVKQEKTDKELDLRGKLIIDSLEDLNIAEKYKVISCLYSSLVDTIKSEGGVIVEEDL